MPSSTLNPLAMPRLPRNLRLTIALAVFVLIAAFGSAALFLLKDRAAWLAAVFTAGMLAAWMSYRRASVPAETKKVFGDALRSNEFVPYLQPLVDAQTGRWVGAEVLVRWQHSKYGLIPPDRFIPTAEQSGFIMPITKSLMSSVANVLQGVRLPRGFHISFNVCPSQLTRGDLLADCRHFLRTLAHREVELTLELTERQPIVPDRRMNEMLSTLRQAGVKISIDDFGTGHANLSLLNSMKVDVLKVDKDIVQKSFKNQAAHYVLDSVISLAKKLRIKIVAEGVETSSEHEHLRLIGLDVLQGFHFARPMPLEIFADRVLTHAA